MANHKAEEYTRKEIEKLVGGEDFAKVLMFGNLKSREIASTVVYETLNGGDFLTVHKHKERLKQLEAKVAQLQEQRDAQVPDPKKYFAYDDLRTPRGLYMMADFIRCAADRIAELEE